MCNVPEKALVSARFWLVAAIGGSVALFGVVANGMLAKLFVTNSHYRHSPFFFLGFVAVFDTLLDLVYILLLVSVVWRKAPRKLILCSIRGVSWDT